MPTRMQTEPVPSRKVRSGANRVTVSGRNGLATLHLNGKMFSIPLDDTSRLAEFCRACEQSDDELARRLRLIIDKVNSQPRSASFDESWSELRLQIQRDTLHAANGSLSAKDAGLLSAINDYMVTKLARRRKPIRSRIITEAS